MSIVTEITRINTNIANSYTAVDNKNGTLPQVQNSANLASAINSIEVIEQATAEGESLSLANTKAMPYSDYVVEGKSGQATILLPDGYTQVEYIESTGTQYIDTGVIANSTMRIDLKCRCLGSSFVFGSRSSVSSGYSGLTFEESNPVNVRWGNSILVNDNQYVVNQDYIVHIENGNSSINNKSSQTSYGNSFFNENIYLFAINNNGTSSSINLSQFGKNRIYYLIVKRNNSLIRNFIPCYRNSDNEIGLYDTVNNVFYTNSGTGTFLKGNNVSMPSPEYPSEIHSVADDVNLALITSTSSTNYNSILKNGEITINGTSTSADNVVVYLNDQTDLKLKENQSYIISIIFTGEISGDTYKAVYLNFGDTNVLAGSISSNSKITYTYTPNVETIFKLVNFDLGANNTFNNMKVQIKVQKGTTPTSYSPYNQGTVTIKQRGKNLFNYTKASDANNTNVTQYRIFEIDGLKPNTQYNINNMGFTQNLNNQYCYLWNDTTYAGSTDRRALAAPSEYNTQVYFNSNAEGKIYLAIYPTDTTTWESVISYLENAQIEERLTSNRLRTISR